MLLRTLGREVKNYGSLTVGLQVLQESLRRPVSLLTSFALPMAVGFPRSTGHTHALVKLLEYMARSPRFKEFYDSLPSRAWMARWQTASTERAQTAGYTPRPVRSSTRTPSPVIWSCPPANASPFQSSATAIR